MRKPAFIIFIFLCISKFLFAQSDQNPTTFYEWSVTNTGTNVGERVVTTINSGTIGAYTGAAIVGQIIDGNSNWGNTLPTVANFKLFVNFSNAAYALQQDVVTPGIILELKSLSSTQVALVANCSIPNRQVRLFLRYTTGTVPALTMGNPGIINTDGTTLISQPTYIAQWATDASGNMSNSNSGNVSVNLLSATSKFVVTQNTYLGTAAQNNLLVSSVGGRVGNVLQNNLWLVRNTDGTDWVSSRFHDGISIDASFLTPQVNTRTWWERDPYNNVQSWGTSASTYLTINKGNVGIGTAAPISTFQVNYNSIKFSAGSAASTDLFYGTSYLGFNAARSVNGSTASWTIDGDNYHNGGGVIYGDIFGNIYFAPIVSAGTSQRTLTDLAIKSNITFKVGNNGVTYAKAISVQTTGWPDYVFKKDYKLPGLNFVKEFIAQNQHLPEMPSAQQIEKDGLNLGEMNRILTQKVEELTLYLIDKDKELKKQQLKINRQETQLAAQQVQIDELKQQLTIIIKSLKTKP
ncbi:hypothetical protein ACEN9X_22540 [Mucilaginibacter sp. Mucisp86]|uniref:hypothetical protein n=1 Tax=Mucilaginibacter sp. Mucisp86 TaxID=3243060 RepID=UPI0039B3AEEC